MRLAGLIQDDFVNGKGVSVSVWFQGCPHHCKGCHSSQTWDFNGGTEISDNELYEKIEAALTENGIERNLSILGGEPLCPENVNAANNLGYWFKMTHPDKKIYLWTGYTKEQLQNMGYEHMMCFDWADYIITGLFELDKRDVTLELRGSTNQEILIRGRDF